MKRRDPRLIVAANIDKWKRLSDLNDADLYTAAGISRKTFTRRIERLDDSSFNILELDRMAKCMKCSVSDLVEGV